MRSGIGKDDIRNIMEEVLADLFGVAPGTTVFGAVSTSASTTAAAISVVLDTQGRWIYEIRVTASGAATYAVEGSHDGITYYPGYDIVLAGAGSDDDGGFNAYRYIRVRSTDVLDHTVTITAAR